MNKLKKSYMFHVIIVLLIIIAILAFFLWNRSKKEDNNNSNKDLSITIVTDKFCLECNTTIEQLKQVPDLSTANFEIKNFSDEWVEDMLVQNELNFLPVVIFSDKKVKELNQFLVPLKKDDWYSLQVWAKFDPFADRSDKWFLLMSKDLISQIKSSSYTKWNPDAKITWLEYSDLECPYCAKLHNSWIPEALEEKYGENLNIVFNHFPLEFHKNAMPGAQILECVWEQKWSEAFYSLIEKSFKEEKSDKNFLMNEAETIGVDMDALEECLDSDKYENKILLGQKRGADNFWITWTPWNVLINNQTGEYQVIAWAYPLEVFEQAIDLLLAK